MVCRTALLLLACAAGLAIAQTADDVVRETQRLKAQIDQERRLASADSARQAEWRRQGKGRLAAMRAEATRLARERDSLRRFIDRKLTAPPPPPPTAAGAVQRKAFAAAVASRIDALLPKLPNSPEVAASRADLEALSRSLKSGKTDAAEGLSRLFDAWAEGLDASSRLLARPGTHTTSTGRAVRGTYLTVGSHLEAFVDQAGEFATLRPRGASAWQDVADPRIASSLRAAAETVSGRAAPSWAWIPVAPAGKVGP